MLFNYLAGLDAIPIVLDVHSEDEIVAAVKAIAPSFGGINLEDIAAPLCFNIEERLINDLDIPVFHDDQHGTAIVALAGLINAAKLTGRELNNSKVVLVGSGAAGTSIAKLLYAYAPKIEIVVVDSKGIVSRDRSNLNSSKKGLLKFTNPKNVSGSLADSLKESDIFIGVSKAGLLNEELIKLMNKDPIIIAMANPVPEIMPELAIRAGASIVATGRSDFPNQVNNALAFPGIFRGALDYKVRKITNQHKLDVAQVIAELVDRPTKDQIIPSILDERLVPAIAAVFKQS
jgi:malate dehydrogenase (oxaloacetate-decarboxylating)